MSETPTESIYAPANQTEIIEDAVVVEDVPAPSRPSTVLAERVAEGVVVGADEAPQQLSAEEEIKPSGVYAALGNIGVRAGYFGVDTSGSFGASGNRARSAANVPNGAGSSPAAGVPRRNEESKPAAKPLAEERRNAAIEIIRAAQKNHIDDGNLAKKAELGTVIRAAENLNKEDALRAVLRIKHSAEVWRKNAAQKNETLSDADIIAKYERLAANAEAILVRRREDKHRNAIESLEMIKMLAGKNGKLPFGELPS